MLRHSILQSARRALYSPTWRVASRHIRRTDGIKIAFNRGYATSLNEKAESLTQEQTQRINDIAQKLRSNPEIKTLLEQFQEILVNNGFKPENPPSMFDMIRLLSKKDVKEHLLKLKAELDKANIQFGPEDIQSFMNFYNSQKK